MASSANKGAMVTAWDCAGCGVRCEREPARGQIPKWCKGCRSGRAKKQIECAHCGTSCRTWRDGRYCSRTCASAAQVKPKAAKPKFDPRGPLRRGYEDGDADLFFAAVADKADTSGECWIWPRLNRSGYPTVSMGGRDLGVHRLVIEVKHGAPLGTQHAHHKCANTACVNPDHLQPVTHRDNVAEMLARQSYLARIRELESALAEVDPRHPLLALVVVA